MIRYIADDDHYNVVMEKVKSAKIFLWIGTADIKDLYVQNGQTTEPFLGTLARMIKNGIEVRLIHAKEPGQPFREDFDRYPILFDSLERVLCPRIHFKIIVIDGEFVYIGSANLTGAGIGMKNKNRRNFEAGIFTDEPTLVADAMEHFDSIWRGEHCNLCDRRKYCSDPLV